MSGLPKETACGMPEEPKGAIFAQLELQDKLLDNLHKTIARLEDKLSPILVEEAKDTGNLEQVEGVNEISSQLVSRNSRLDNRTLYMNALIDRINI